MTEYIYDLEKKDIYNLGIVLGLSRTRIMKQEDSKTFLDDIVYAWLQGVDKCRHPGTWRILVEALRDRRLRQNGIARKIYEEKGGNSHYRCLPSVVE